MKIVRGDLIQMALDGEFDVVVQGCNCLCRMENGIAKTIAETFPEAVEADNATTPGDRDKLGTYSKAVHTRGEHFIYIVNAYTQYDREGDDEEVLVDYDAVRSCMQKIKGLFFRYRIGIPLIGAGLARGNWAVIERIILEELGDLDVTIVHFQT